MSIHRPLLGSIAASLAALSINSTSLPEEVPTEVERLIALSEQSNAALMRGDAATYSKLLKFADDFTLMSPFGGEPSRGAEYTPERVQRMASFFRNGRFKMELVESYASKDMVVLALIERTDVEVGGLSAQNWALRVTLVYRRAGAEWVLIHRHADPLVDPVALDQAAALARGERQKPEEQ